MLKTIAAALIASALGAAAPENTVPQQKPTIVLVHGAFADASSWTGVVQRLTPKGYRVIAAANPLRSVADDAAYVATLVKSIKGPVVLVGHSYGGAVISAAAANTNNVKALVYVAAFAPDVGETSLSLTGKFPGSSLSGTLAPPVTLSDGTHDLYIEPAKFPHQFAADLPRDQAAVMAVTQRPVRDSALSEKSTVTAWKTKRSWAVYGSADLNIPPASMAFMAARAKSKTTVIANASHVLMISHPDEVAAVIEEAADTQ